MSTSKIDALREKLEKEFTPSIAVELAALLQDSSRVEARELLFQALTKDPNLLRARLQLAKLFYLDKMTEFCVRELLELKRRANVPSIDRLLESFGAVAQEFSHQSQMVVSHHSEMEEESIVGEIDIDFDEAEEGMN